VATLSDLLIESSLTGGVRAILPCIVRDGLYRLYLSHLGYLGYYGVYTANGIQVAGSKHEVNDAGRPRIEYKFVAVWRMALQQGATDSWAL